MSEVLTRPGPTRLSTIQAPAVPGAAMTSATTVMTFSEVKHLLADKPLRGGIGLRTSEDLDDLLAIEESRREGGKLLYSDLRRELGLND